MTKSLKKQKEVGYQLDVTFCLQTLFSHFLRFMKNSLRNNWSRKTTTYVLLCEKRYVCVFMGFTIHCIIMTYCLYIWFAVTPCVYLLARQNLFLENCLALFYYRGVDVLDVQESSQFWKELSCFFSYSPGGRCRKLAGRTTSAYRMVFNCTTTESVLKLVSMFQLACSSHRQNLTQLCLLIIGDFPTLGGSRHTG